MANQQALLSVVDSQIASLPKVSGGEPYLSRETTMCCCVPKSWLKRRGRICLLEYILLALVDKRNADAKIVQDAGVNVNGLRAAMPICAREAR